MKSKYCYPLVGILSVATLAWSQDTQSAGEISLATPEMVTPVSATSQLVSKVEAVKEQVRQEPNSYEAEAQVAQLDDSIPLPISAVIEARPEGDVEIAPASGDPFFLSFIAGPYSPPDDELIDPALLQLDGGFGDARPGKSTYAMVMFQRRITDERLQALKALDCRVLGFHPHYTIKVAIPVDRLLEVSTLDFVRWVGAPRTWQKVHPAMRGEVKGMAPGDPLDMYISVFESDMNEDSVAQRIGSVWKVTPEEEEGVLYEGTDARAIRYQSNGWMQRSLESKGLQIREYRPDINTFVATGTPANIDELSKLDFVQFIEPIPVQELNSSSVHDESIPMVGGDETRAYYDGSLNSIAQVGIVDSGVETAHSDIDVFAWGWNCTAQSSPFDDIQNGGSGHGTHVTGTILGNGGTQADHTGMAPGLATWSQDQALFAYRIFPNPCSDSLSTIMNTMNTPVGSGTVPHVVNNSWGSTFLDLHVPTGSEADPRTIDNHVFNTGQVWVWSSGNYGYQNVGIQATAKNALTVGNSLDYNDTTVGNPGELAADSGKGPLADGRWKPNVNAPGRFVSSAVANNNTGYAAYSGTSMAAPHVTGLIAQLVDHHSFLRDRQPAEIAALLMATAQTHDNEVISTPTSTHLDTFGAGRVNAVRTHWTSSDWGWNSWTVTLNSGNSSNANFTVPVGATRLVVVMSYIEEAASAGAGTALVNDFDMYLDRDPIDPAGNTGEYSAQQSSVDNAEIRIINNPASGAWRWKIWPDSTSSTVKVGITAFWTLGNIAPTNNVTVTASDSYIQPFDQIDVDVNVAATDYISAATIVDINGSSRTVHSKSSDLHDGIVSDLSDSANVSDIITLGDIRQGVSKNASYHISFPTEGAKSVIMSATSENAAAASASVAVYVDGTDPATVTNLTSPSHALASWSNDPTIQWTWTAATDNLSGILGYGIYEATSPGIPGTTQDIGAVTTYTSGAYPSSSLPRYFSIRSVDRSGNWDAQYVSSGPYYIDTAIPGNPTYQSSSVPQGGSSCSGSITVNWNAGTDLNSGVAGYGLFWSSSPTGTPSPVLDTTGLTDTLVAGPGTYYLHVITKDVAGNWTTTPVHFGPFTLTASCFSTFCDPANNNSTGAPAVLTGYFGSGSGSGLHLDMTGGVPGQLGYMLVGNEATSGYSIPGANGPLCLIGTPTAFFYRYNVWGTSMSSIGGFDAGGVWQNASGTSSSGFGFDVPSLIPGSVPFAIMAGDTWKFQGWYRDTPAGVGQSNFSNGLSVTFP